MSELMNGFDAAIHEEKAANVGLAEIDIAYRCC